MLMDAAKALAPLDAALSRETYLHALDAAIINGGGDAVRIAEAALAAPAPEVPTRPVDLLLDGLATTLTQGYAAGVPGLRLALTAFRDAPQAESVQSSQSDRWLWLAGRNAVMPTIVRKSEEPYRWEIGEAPLSKVANVERKMPKSFISRDGFGITARAREYFAPLILGEDYPPYENGLPVYARLKNQLVDKKLPSWHHGSV